MSSYWGDRKQELLDSLAANEKTFFTDLQKYYATEATELSNDIASYYAKYGTNNVLAYRNLLETMSESDVQLLYQKFDAFAEKYPSYAYLLPVRESIYKLDRLEGLRQSVLVQQLRLGAYEIEKAKSHFIQTALEFGNAAAQKAGFGTNFYTIDSAMIKLVVGQDWCNGKDFSERIWTNRQALAQTLQTDIVNGIIRGDSYKTIARNVQGKFTNVSRRNIERLVFTENTFLANEAAMQVYADDPEHYQYYEYVAVMDERTCLMCAELEGQRFPISARSPGDNFPPMHPWCRCFFDPVYEK